MGDPLYVNTEGVLGMARVHDAVAAGLGQLQNGGGLGQSVGPAGPAATHGLIAFGMNSALGAVMARRDDILQSTGAAGQQLSEQLHRAAESYRTGDEQGARGLSSAAEGIPGHDGGVSAGTPGGLGAAVPGSPAAGGDVAQTLGQVGQQAGQLAAGVAQALGQIPGQLAQGLTGVLGGIASGLGGIDGVGAGHAAGSGLGGLSDPGGVDSVGAHDKSDTDDQDQDRRDPERHEKGEDDDRILSVEHRSDAGEAESATGPTGPGGLGGGVTPPPRRPAQTRPQDI